MIKKIVDDLGLDMYDDNQTTRENIELVNELLEYMLGDKVSGVIEYVFKEEYDRFYREEAMPHKIVDEYENIFIIKLGDE